MGVSGGDLLLAHEGDAGAMIVPVAGDVVALSPRQLFWRRFRADRVAMFSAGVVILFVIIAIIAPLIVHLLGMPGPEVQDPNKLNAVRRADGTDRQRPVRGRRLWVRTRCPESCTAFASRC